MAAVGNKRDVPGKPSGAAASASEIDGLPYGIEQVTLSPSAQILAQMRLLIAGLQSVLEARSDIDRAIGILMSRSGDTEDEALVRLRSLSEDEHLQLVEIARKIIDDAVRSGPPHRSG